ncbi:MAG: Gfo/Idh/MocA family oxidoreductase [Candidatus Pacebacteria bacterium]|nr:Gfo/Idh/MocA family oxidoreductase [Candidatus Paceibacterota bacterium]
MNKKFAVIGKGFIYNLHQEAIAKIGGEIVDIVDESNGPDAWKEMVKRTAADCIVILAPNHLHFEMARFSAECGKMVLCEKPLTLKSEEAKILAKYPNIFTVYQLRYHPSAKKLKSEVKGNENYQIEMNISVHRDEDYWQSWKGREEKSGGIIFNLGIHYFDLMLYFFGKADELQTKSLTYKTGEGKISGKNYSCDWRITTEAPKENQCRIFKINGVNYDFTSKENLHFFVYQDLLEGKGVAPEESMKSIELIEKIYENSKNN